MFILLLVSIFRIRPSLFAEFSIAIQNLTALVLRFPGKTVVVAGDLNVEKWILNLFTKLSNEVMALIDREQTLFKKGMHTACRQLLPQC